MTLILMQIQAVLKKIRIMKVIEYGSCGVYPFNEGHYTPMKKFQVINEMFSIDTSLGERIVEELNNDLDFTDTVKHSLLCTNEAKGNGVEINDVPIRYKESSRFDVKFVQKGTSVPLQMNGPTSYIPMRHSTGKELNKCRYVELTSYNEWNPYNDEMNISFLKSGQILSDPWDSYISCLYTSFSGIAIVVNLNTKPGLTIITCEYLAKLSNIGLAAARRTLKVTKYNIRCVPQDSLYRRFRIRIHQRRYNQFGGCGGRFSPDTCFFESTLNKSEHMHANLLQ